MQWLMLQQEEPEDYVIATGQQHSVRELIETAAAGLDMSIRWEGRGVDEVGIEQESGKVLVAVDSRYYRPTEVDTLLGDATKAREKLGWKPRISFKELIGEMIASDLKEAQRDRLVQQEGFRTFDQHE
jgi:GDPmannose 4,6-dehydratase